MPRLVAELHVLIEESAKLEKAINLSAVALAKAEANLPARRSAQSEGGRGMGYGY